MSGPRINVDASEGRSGGGEPNDALGHQAPAQRRPAPSEAAPVAILLALSVLAWVLSSHLAAREMRMGLVAGSDGSMDGPAVASMAMSFPLFMASWVITMVAMMFPAVTPVVLTVSRWLSSRKAAGRRTASLVTGYLVVWSAIGGAAYALLHALQSRLPAGSTSGLRIAAIVLILAGVYQLTPLKSACLRHCRSPLSIVVRHAALLSRGTLGPFRVGLEHGCYCVGCCWSLMLVLLLLGMMNLVWMAVVAASREIEPCTAAAAVSGGLSPQTPSINRSRETTSFACRSRSARTARCFAPPSSRTVPLSRTSSGPRTLNSMPLLLLARN